MVIAGCMTVETEERWDEEEETVDTVEPTPYPGFGPA